MHTGPAHNSKELSKGDDIIAIDGIDIQTRFNHNTFEHLAAALKGSDEPGTSVTLTVRKNKTREIKDVTLTRMDTALIADRRMLFEKFTSLKDRAIVDNDIVVRDTVDEVIVLWSKMVQADALQEHQLHSSIKNMKDSLQSALQSVKTKLPQVQNMAVSAGEHQKLQKCMLSKTFQGHVQGLCKVF